MVLVLPVKFSFFEDNEVPLWNLIDYIIDIFFAIDILLTFFTGYHNDSEVYVTSHWRIALRYLKFWFWLDCLSIVPFQLIIPEGGYTVFLRVSRLPRLYKITKLSRVIRSAKTVREQNNFLSYIQDLLIRNPGFSRILKNLSSIFLTCHIFACTWHYIGVLESDSTDNWIV